MTLLIVECPQGHRLAEVLPGPVVSYSGSTEPLEDPFLSDGLPTWCECGPHVLSRRWVLAQVGGARSTVPA